MVRSDLDWRCTGRVGDIEVVVVGQHDLVTHHANAFDLFQERIDGHHAHQKKKTDCGSV